MCPRAIFAVAVSLFFLVLPEGCGASSTSGVEDSVPSLDAMLGRDPSAMTDAMLSVGSWLGRMSYGGTDYRVYETTVGDKKVHLFYAPKGNQQGLTLYMYDVEPFQIAD